MHTRTRAHIHARDSPSSVRIHTTTEAFSSETNNMFSDFLAQVRLIVLNKICYVQSKVSIAGSNRQKHNRTNRRIDEHVTIYMMK